MPSRFGRLALAFAALAVAVPVSNVAGQSTECSVARPRARADQWTEIAVPEPSIGEPAITDFAALSFPAPFGPGRTAPPPPDVTTLFVTNGRVVHRSVDGGCTWEEVYTPTRMAGETAVPGPTVYVDSVEVAPSPRAGTRVYLLLRDEARAYVAVSTDLGDSWDSASVGLPPQASGGALKVTPNPLVAYALMNAPSVAPPAPLLGSGEAGLARLYKTTNGGEHWVPVNLDVAPERLDDFVLDAADPRALYAWNRNAMFASIDSGTTFRRVTQVQPPISTADVYRFPPVEPARVLAFRANQRAAYRSADGGVTWSTTSTPGIVKSAAHAFATDVYAMSSDRGVHITGNGIRVPIDISPKGVTPTNLQFRHVTPVTLFGSAGNRIYARTFTPQVRPIVRPNLPALPPVNLRGGVAANIKASSLVPATQSIPLLPGQTRRVQYRLDLAPTPTPLDIFFATDSTGSMRGLIGGLRTSFQDIINDLAASGIDVHFGLADFRDYPIPGFGSPGDYPYRLLREIGEVNEELKDAIESIEPGGGMNLDSALAAAYQAATGEGQEIAPGSGAGGREGRWIEPSNPNWRRNSLKVIVLAADVRAHDPETDPGYPGPSYATVIRTLNRRGIEFVGLAVGDGDAVDGGPYQSLTKVARGTRTVAPVTGTDCDADGEVDVAAGEPLVCRLAGGAGASGGVAPAIVNLLKSVTDLNTVGLELRGDDRVVRHLTAPVYDDINVKVGNRLLFDVEFSCALETAGESYPVTLRARSGDTLVANATAKVDCILPEGPKPVFLPPNPVAAAALPPPPPPPPAPIPQTQPNPNPNPNPNPQFQPAAQGQPGYGMAAEEQEQINLALATGDLVPDDDTQLAMSRLDREPDYGPAMLAGLVMTAAAGAAVARSRTSPRLGLNTFKK